MPITQQIVVSAGHPCESIQNRTISSGFGEGIGFRLRVILNELTEF